MRDLPHLAGRLFDAPLLMDARKLDGVVPAFMRRLAGDPDQTDPADQRDPGEPTIAGGIAVIPVIGSLVRRKTAMDAFSGLSSYGDIVGAVSAAAANPGVKAVLLQIDSFGGEAAGCFEACDALFALRGTKPIWASADVYALSGGYALASCADRLYVAPSGQIGSIGVVAVHCEFSQQNAAEGIAYTVLRAGDMKAAGNPLEPLDPRFAAKMQQSLDRNRAKFADMVVRNRRGVTLRQVLATEGTWLEPEEALPLKLVDGVATFADAFGMLADAVAAPQEPPAPIGQEPPDPSSPSLKLVADNAQAIDAGRAAGRSEVIAVTEICQLAGRPDLLAYYLSTGMTHAAVVRDLACRRHG
ncbi:MAG TPA: S49 family peptidase [Stellaceae bacterium]|nr:S49 family peptidase [Stellaceae bacterium]